MRKIATQITEDKTKRQRQESPSELAHSDLPYVILGLEKLSYCFKRCTDASLGDSANAHQLKAAARCEALAKELNDKHKVFTPTRRHKKQHCQTWKVPDNGLVH